jgi:hypothetical protein
LAKTSRTPLPITHSGSELASSKSNPIISRHSRQALLVALALIFSLWSGSHAAAQVSVTTYHNDIARTGQNVSETVLTPANVNVNQFGLLYSGSLALDSWAPAQPLYVPNVTINGVTHNVVYVATLYNSVYAFDADTGQNLWYAPSYEPPTPFDEVCTDSNYEFSPSAGAGIVGTPVIDSGAGILYFVTKTGDGVSTPWALYLHAVDFTTGIDEPGISPVLIVPPGGPAFMPQYQMNRPALLLNNGIVYVALGSTGCKGLKNFPKINNHGWLLAYNTVGGGLTPLSTFLVTSPTTNNAGIWQGGGGPAADLNGDIYVETADGVFDQDIGGADYALSVLKLDPNLDSPPLDFFTPYNWQTSLEPNDLDLSSVGPIVLNQVGPSPVVVASGKNEEIYLLNPASMGEFCSSCTASLGNTNILQDILPPSFLSGCLGVAPAFTCRYGSPSYWNNNIYFSEIPGPLLAYGLTANSNGVTVSTSPTSQSPLTYSGAGGSSISANGTTNAILWAITWGNGSPGKSPGTLRAFDATNLQTQFYASSLAGKRDTLGTVPSFVTPTIANGKVFAASENQLMVYGLLSPLTVTAGNSQSGSVGTTLPVTLSVQAISSYTGQPVQGVNITFSATPAGGTFGTPISQTNSAGIATTTYTLPTKPGVFTISASGPSTTTTNFQETATAGPPASLTLVSGGHQKGTVGTTLPAPVVVAVKDPYSNPVSGVSVSFTDVGINGLFNPTSANTNSLGQASSFYTLPTKASPLTVFAMTGSFSVGITEQSVAGSPASVNYISGNHQSEPPNTLLPAPLVVSVKDQYGNLVAGATVDFTDNGAGGTLSSLSATTTANGRASVTYITGSQPGTVTITASISGLTPFNFTETVEAERTRH